MSDVTRLLSAMEAGDPTAADQLLPLVYQELRRLAAAKLSRETSGHSLQPTLLVHEAYLRLAGGDQPQHWSGRGHFFGAAAEAMRRVLIEHARQKSAQKRGGDLYRVALDPDGVVAEDRVEDVLALDEALSQLEVEWPEKAKLVKLRYFAGLTIPEASRALRISTATAERHWRFARAWLHAKLNTGE